ncbi:hypothetical protein A3H80_02895 [Candidatus Roizmanbacteria bacterium RIFCSPLOWO2_02_FULL_37_19]|uniref:Uncharacterized protein n=1 Tax=Candidatus Roizmanbacteria bacterium RIFCSPHIGHO2_02_FULL_37_24 TaxID=1802037 RepID=A0A1F7GZ92_9BACT|nr:MAG: hypothetical protein A2862_03710 [Candidatus Roizmanbacteria bacterium RIFCSPHIGHO2_01_FULL_38_41]OGK24271.1 MAG: hypothetical protein A3C24_04190 [Candidatus Roizmanbacteria bacterium RIFCSPHIGHO2_02_FULL_37_24]OGK32173.1 MAG: hypothetical protein A3E10_03565 [Candidatus Roizmanbacteria bacterium RIFCSPHIGHO2_12_FULL_37_23]OGK44440.1 MAG: hypothetical protein A2956_01200 [Candidatus Roizmanbacteria bacterium RIFCSPLOWO2_01_FULL_37_57]OGK53808.1 MAG: hypothetical protein A3H80_02895 [Ca
MTTRIEKGATLENTFSSSGPITYQLRRFADRHFPQQWPRDLLAELVDPVYLLDDDAKRLIRLKDEEADDGFTAKLVIDHGRGILPTVIWQIDGNAMRKRITTSRPGLRSENPVFVRCRYDGSGKVFRLAEVSATPEGNMPELVINSDWSNPTALIEIPSPDRIVADFVRRQGDLEVRIAEDDERLYVATLHSDPFTVPIRWDMTDVG